MPTAKYSTPGIWSVRRLRKPLASTTTGRCIREASADQSPAFDLGPLGGDHGGVGSGESVIESSNEGRAREFGREQVDSGFVTAHLDLGGEEFDGEFDRAAAPQGAGAGFVSQAEHGHGRALKRVEQGAQTVECPVLVGIVAREDRGEKGGGIMVFPGQMGQGDHVARQGAARERAAGADISFLADARLGAQAALDLTGVRADKPRTDARSRWRT